MLLQKYFLMALFLCCVHGQLAAQQTDSLSFLSEKEILASLQHQFPSIDEGYIKKILRFDTDTMIVVGYFYFFQEYLPSHTLSEHVIYKTTNRGKKWRVIKFEGNNYSWHSYHLREGKIWMGGSDKILRFSTDFGETWMNLACPFPYPENISCIYMVDSLKGICAGGGNYLSYTKDNWKTTTACSIPTRKGRYKVSKEFATARILKVAWVDSTIFINQNERIFYSNIDSIEWRAFNIPVSKFRVTPDKKAIELYSINDSIYTIASDLSLLQTTLQPPPLFHLFRKEQADSITVAIDAFLAKGIDSFTIHCSHWAQDGMSGLLMNYKELSKSFNFVQKDSLFVVQYTPSTTHWESPNFSFTEQELRAVFNDNTLNSSSSEISWDSFLTQEDIEDYQALLQQKQLTWAKGILKGYNFSYFIPQEHQSFEDYQAIIQSPQLQEIQAILSCQDYSLLGSKKPTIKIVIKNKQGSLLTISNEHACYLSLPWKVELEGIKRTTFSKKIHQFLRTKLPQELHHYQDLFGGKFIYRIIYERIKAELKYETSY